jgi:hypothetical protein
MFNASDSKRSQLLEYWEELSAFERWGMALVVCVFLLYSIILLAYYLIEKKKERNYKGVYYFFKIDKAEIDNSDFLVELLYADGKVRFTTFPFSDSSVPLTGDSSKRTEWHNGEVCTIENRKCIALDSKLKKIMIINIDDCIEATSITVENLIKSIKQEVKELRREKSKPLPWCYYIHKDYSRVEMLYFVKIKYSDLSSLEESDAQRERLHKYLRSQFFPKSTQAAHEGLVLQ